MKITQVDAFTNKPFHGNPAAICVLESPREQGWMQSVAAEMNLSETAFLHPEADGYRLRWFTPAAEVVLCGHATLAAAHVLWEEAHSREAILKFHTLSGLLTAERKGDWIEMNFPVDPVTPCELPPGFQEALGARIVFSGKTAIRHFVELESAEALRRLAPDLAGIQRVPPGRVLVTARSDKPEYDFISRYFAPGVGVAEDPVTGSAHCALAPYWSGKLGKNEFMAYQASSRGGELKVRLAGDRVFMAGQAVTVMRADLLVPYHS
jgi:predicted PhzF superfamily epimerase YddE/YHI9